MLKTLTLPVLRRLRREIKDSSLSAPDKAELLAEVAYLTACYLHEVHTTIPGFQGSHSLAHWREYFRIMPEWRTSDVKKRLTYAQDTKVDFSLSPLLESRLR